MYDSTTILGTTGLYQRIGLKEPTKTGYTGKLDAASKVTRSGLTYDEFHSLANFINILDCQDDPDITDAEVNALILTWQKEAIKTGLNRVFEGKRDLIENRMLYTRENVFENAIANEGKFVGFEISVPETANIVNVLNSVILQFNGVKAFKLYLFHSSKKSKVADFSATSVADDFYKLELNQKLYNQTSTYGSGKFYFGYFQNDLGTVQAYDRVWNGANKHTTFNGIRLRSISVEPNGTNLFDIGSLSYRSECWGLNLDISSFCDYTNLIMTNQAMFDPIQGYSFAIRVLELIKTSGRINATKRVNEKLPDIAAFDLETQTGENVPRNVGLNQKLKIEIDRVRKSLFNESSIIIT